MKNRIFCKPFFKTLFVLALAALTAAVPAGCGRTEADPSSEAGATFEIDFGTTGASAEELASGSYASSLPSSEISAEPAAAQTGEDTASISGGTAAGAAAGVMPGGSTTAEADHSAFMTTGNAAAEYSTSAEAIALRDGIPERSGADTDLKESVLSQALYACTGWGQSTGSSLHAIAAATLLLDWSNSIDAGIVDSDLLEDTVRSEISRLSPVQAQTLRNNWSFIYYDADTILDSFKEVESLAEDAGCLEDARKASENKNSRKNWKAVYNAIEETLAVP